MTFIVDSPLEIPLLRIRLLVLWKKIKFKILASNRDHTRYDITRIMFLFVYLLPRMNERVIIISKSSENFHG